MMRRILLVVMTALATAGLGWASRAPYAAEPPHQGLLRLSWRMRGERQETCRPRTQAELDALPVHMRTPEICEGRLLSYRLVVQVDEAAPDSIVIRPAGAKGDRPVYVLDEQPLAPGPHRVRVRFHVVGGSADEISLDMNVDARAGAIELVTMESGRLVHVSGG